MKNTILLLSAIWLSGCELLPIKEAPPKIVEVKVQTTVACIRGLPEKPQFKKDAELLLMSDQGFIDTIKIERLKRKEYIILLENAIEGCDIAPSDSVNASDL